MPIKFEIKKIELIMAANIVGFVLKTAKHYGKINKEEWMDNGSFYVKLELPAGIMEEFISELNDSCHGKVDIKILKE